MRIVDVQIAQRSYPVLVGPGARAQLGLLIKQQVGVQRVAVIADAAVADRFWRDIQPCLGMEAMLLRFPPGESSKSLDQAGELYDQLAEARIARRDLIITLGGGVAGDLGGFVAATWLRGVRYIQVATTLESAIDASVGGKTAVNHRAAKNLIGAFHHPVAVVIDVDFLTTLPPREFTAGLAESVKHGAACDATFLAWQESNIETIGSREPRTLMELVARNCQIKAGIVARDEREESVRAVLNYGHTIGHAVEHVLGYELRHGECVALGMIAENELAVRRGLLQAGTAERVRSMIERLGLPTRLPRPIPAGQVVGACRMDKKVDGGTVNFMLLRDIGAIERIADVRDEEIVAALRPIA